VVVIGEILENNARSGKMIGSYIDVVFEPGYRTQVGTTTKIFEETPGICKVVTAIAETPSTRTLTPTLSL
jgi:hypothetical protein